MAHTTPLPKIQRTEPDSNAMSRLTTNQKRPQFGVSLVIVLIFLAILSLLGVSAIQTSSLSSRVARNEADRSLAFQAAEAALRDAEQDVKNRRFDDTECVAGIAGCRADPISGATGFDNACTAGRCCTATALNVCPASGTMTRPVWQDRTRWTNTGGSVAYGTFTGATALPVVSQPPRYLIEYFPTSPYADVYRITAVGYGVNASTQVMLQSTIKRRPTAS